MEYFVVDFRINCDETLLQSSRDLLAAAAGDVGFESFEDTQTGIKGYVQKEFFDKDILNESINTFPISNVSITYTVSDAEYKDWNEQWEDAGFEPVNIDNRVVIYDVKHAKDYYFGDKIGIGIEAKLAFGTGTHLTTQMIISCLLSMKLRDKNVLDCGCGTGILGIAASKLGANTVVGYDIDEWSVDNASHNVDINNVNNIDILHGDVRVLSQTSDKFDVITANLNCNILLNDMPKLKSMMNYGAKLVMSGFYKEDTNKLIDKGLEIQA